MASDRGKDRHASDGKPVLVRMSAAQRAELEGAVQALRDRAKVPGQRITLAGFVLDVALEAAREINRKKG
jgi:hypothetical protein